MNRLVKYSQSDHKLLRQHLQQGDDNQQGLDRDFRFGTQSSIIGQLKDIGQ
jgi:hypothetical protein